MTAAVTWWPSLTDTRGRVEQLPSWDAFFGEFSKVRPYLGDSKHPGWSPAVFEPPERDGKNVRAVTALVLDVDGGDTIEHALELWAGLGGFIHTTRHHSPEAHRFRVILPLARPVTPAEHAQLWQIAFKRSGETLDPRAKDAPRFWFVPGIPDEGTFEWRELHGDLLEPDAWLAEPTSRRSPAVSAPAARAGSYVRAAVDGEVARVRAASNGQRNDTLNKAAFALGQLVGGGALSEQAAHGALAAAADDVGLPSREAEKTITSGLEAGKRSPRRIPEPATASAAAARATTPTAEPAESGIIRLGADLHRVVDDAVRALARDAELYQRDGQLVRIIRVAGPEADRERVAVGSAQIRPLTLPTLRERLTRAADFAKMDNRSGEWRVTVPPDRVVSAVEARGEWPVRALVGIIDTPSMRPDGTLLDAPGHDAATGYVYAPAQAYPPVRPCPDTESARAALNELAEPWADFPFRGEPDRFVPVAALLTLVARPAIQGACPAIVVDASTRGSGKTLLARAITTLAHGREAALMTWPPDDVELEKVLGAYAMRGATVVCFDNLKKPFDGGALDKILTCADRTELRVLGQSTIPSVSWRAVTLATGNNVVLGADTTRRVLVCRLEPQCERPEERRGFAIPDLMAWCREHHPRLVAAALTLLRAYVVAGRPDMELAGWGSYEAWTALVAGAIRWAGGPDVMTTRPTIAGEDDSDTAALRSVIELWPMLAPEGATARAVVNALYPTLQRGEQRTPDGFDALREALETLAPPRRPGEAPSTHRVGNALAGFRRRVVGGKYLDTGGAGERGGKSSWRVREVAPEKGGRHG